MRQPTAIARGPARMGIARGVFLAGLLMAPAVLSVILLQPAPKASGPALITVNTVTDEDNAGDGFCSLREAIINANAENDLSGGDCASGAANTTVEFSVSGTITLESNLDAIQNTVTIDGTGQNITVVGPRGDLAAFAVYSGATLALNSLSIANSSGGGATNNGTLTITNCTFSGNTAPNLGGRGQQHGHRHSQRQQQ